jgi:hypothetical protein
MRCRRGSIRNKSQQNRKLLIHIDLCVVPIFYAKRLAIAISKACGGFLADINKVIHRNSGFLANHQSNQALAG